MSLAHHRMLVEEVLRPLRNRHVLYMPNSGNAGDSLIATGTFDCFRRLSIRFTPIGPSGAKAAGQVVILGGGGNFVPAYATIRNALESYRDSAAQIILLPHTIRGNEDLLAELGDNVTILCRDIESFRHVAAHCHRPQVLLGHDMAFHLDAEAFLFGGNTAPWQAAFQDRLAERKIDLQALAAREKAYLARRDSEYGGPIGGSDVDPSAVFEFGVWPGNAEKSSWCFLEFIRCMRSVVTDRLHVAIAAALLDKGCALFDNSYGKNAEVHLHSLKYHFPKVTLQRREA